MEGFKPNLNNQEKLTGDDDIKQLNEEFDSVEPNRSPKQALSLTKVDADPLQDWRNEQPKERNWDELYAIDEEEDHENNQRNPDQIKSVEPLPHNYNYPSDSTYSRSANKVRNRHEYATERRQQPARDKSLADVAQRIADSEELESGQDKTKKSFWRKITGS